MLNNISKLKAVNLQLSTRVNKLKDESVLLTNAKDKLLRYNDLYAGVILSKHVDAFTFFSSVELNAACMKLMNFTDGEGSFDKDDGLCQNLCRYLKVRFDGRIADVSPPSYKPESEEHAKWLKKCKEALDARKDGLTWKDEYLVFCFYV